MIIGAEIALLCIGLYALFAGKFPTNKKSKYVIEGGAARAIGLVCLFPIPLSLLAGIFIGVLLAAQGKPVTPESLSWVGPAIEVSILVACVVAVSVLSRIYRTPVKPEAEDEMVWSDPA
jgi:hypothetical protein